MAYVYDAAENCVVMLIDKPIDPDHVCDVLLKPRVLH